MSDHDIADELRAPELHAIACWQQPNGTYALVTVDADNRTHAVTASEQKLTQVFKIIGEALTGRPSGTAGLLEDIGLDGYK